MKQISKLVIAVLATGASAGLAMGQSASDNCADAPQVGAGTFTFDTTVASNDGTATCGAAAASPDVWLKYMPASSGLVTISTCGLTAMDTVLNVFDACGGNQIICLDDACGLQTSIDVNTTMNTPIWIRISGFAGGVGSGSVMITPPPPPPMHPWDEALDGGGDAADLPAGAQEVAGSGSVDVITGLLDPSDVDMFLIEVCNYSLFNATTLRGATFDTQLWLFDSDGRGVTFNDDSGGTLQSTLTGQFLTGNGQYYLAISGYNRDALNESGLFIWNSTPFGIERSPDGPGAGGIVSSWSGTGGGGTYSIRLAGACRTTNDALRVTLNATPSTLNAGAATLLEARVLPGSNPSSTNLRVNGDLSAIGYSTSQLFYDDGTNGDITAGDNTFSFLATIPVSQATGTYTVSATVTDAQMRSATASRGIRVFGTDVLIESSADAGDLPDTAQVATGSGALNTILGSINSSADADMFRIRICDPSSFSATTVGTPDGVALTDTQLWLFDSSGNGVTFNDDSVVLRSTITSQFISSDGEYFIAISSYDRDPFSAGGDIWLDMPFAVERTPDGPGAGGPVIGWLGAGGTGNYIITLTGACLVSGGGGCVADVDDGSGTGTPDGGVTIEDLLFYLALFESGDLRADVDNGTFTGTLDGGVTIDDLLYYIFRFEEGC